MAVSFPIHNYIPVDAVGDDLAPSRVSTLVFVNVYLLVAEASRGLVVTSLLNYLMFISSTEVHNSFNNSCLKKLETILKLLMFISKGSNAEGQQALSLAVSCFSLGRLIAAPVFGYLSDRLSCRTVMCITSFLSIGGQILYALCPGDSIVTIIIARGVVGFGSGILPSA